jgi:hypothetical protein
MTRRQFLLNPSLPVKEPIECKIEFIFIGVTDGQLVCQGGGMPESGRGKL